MNFVKKPIIISILLIVVILSGYFILRRGGDRGIDYAVVESSDLIQWINVTGRVIPAERVDLSFDKNGRVTRVNFSVGQAISRGNIIISLSNSDLLAQLSQAEAALKGQKAQLEELKKGVRPEELELYEARVKSAEIALEETKTDLLNRFRSAYARVDDAVRSKSDQLFLSPGTSQSRISFIVINANLKNKAEMQRMQLESILNEWLEANREIDFENDFENDFDKVLVFVEENLNFAEDFLNTIALIINNPNNAQDVSLTIIENWRVNISAARTSIETAISGFSSAKNAFKGAASSLKLAEKDLVFKEIGASQETLNAQTAQVESAEAGVNLTKAQIEKTLLRAPLNGFIIKQEAKVGEVISANVPIVSIISDAGFKIETDIYEEDVARIKLGASADIEIIAFPQEIFKGRVTFIGEVEKIIDGVVYYEVKIAFDQELPKEIKTTMTADVVIQAEKKENVLVIPREAVGRSGGRTIVEVLADGLVKEREIEIGLRSYDKVEVLSGLIEGERVLLR